MRSEVPFSNWWNVGSCASVAEYRSTGIDTRPNEITPDQIARAMLTPYPSHRGTSPGLLFAELPGEFVAAHFRPARQVALLGDLVQFRAGLGRGAAGALALGHCRALLAQRGPGLGRH